MQPPWLVTRWWFFLTLAGCTFSRNAPDDDGNDPDGGLDEVSCSQPGTVVCLDFEQDPDPMSSALDTSGNQHHAAAARVAAVTGGSVDTRAALFDVLGEGGELVIPPSTKLDFVDSFTIEMWVIRTQEVPSNFRYWLVDSNGRYFMSIGDDDELRCGINGDQSENSNNIVPIGTGAWHHVACTLEPGNGGEIKLYIDGAVTGCERGAGTITPKPASIVTVGVRTGGQLFEHFRGTMDNVHIYPTALTPTEICTRANKLDCVSQCPSGSSGGSGSGSGEE